MFWEPGNDHTPSATSDSHKCGHRTTDWLAQPTLAKGHFLALLNLWMFSPPYGSNINYMILCLKNYGGWQQ